MRNAGMPVGSSLKIDSEVSNGFGENSEGTESVNRPAVERKISSARETMTVLHIFSGDLWAGAEVMVFHLLDELRKEPHLKILALSLNEGILSRKLRDSGIETHVISEADHSFAVILLKAYRALKGQRIRVIHSHRYKENLLAFFLAKSTGAGCLAATLHGLSEPPLDVENGDERIGLKTKLDYFLLKHFFTRVVAVSQNMKQVLVQKYGFRPEKIDVIYNGIPIPPGEFSGRDSRDAIFQIGTVGRMVPVKDYGLFLEVAAEMRRQTDKVRFSILGDGPLKEALIRKTKELKMEDDVDFLSPRPDPFSYYQSLDLYLNTSLHEGIPLSILEAMACGRPVVAPKVGGIPEIVSDGEDGFLIDGRDPKKFSDGCLGLLRDKNLRMRIGENASKKVSARFSRLRMAQSYLKLYQQPWDRKEKVGEVRS